MKVSLHTAQASPTGVSGCEPPAVFALAIRTCSRRTCWPIAIQLMAFQLLGRSKDASAPGGAVICFSFFTMVLLVLLPGETRPTWAYPLHYTVALASSVLSMLWLLTRLAVRSARREPGEPTAFPCSTTITGDDLGSLSTPAVRRSRRSRTQRPSLTAYHFGPSLEQSLVACSS